MSINDNSKVYTKEYILEAIKECEDELKDPNTVPRRAANVEYALDKWQTRLNNLKYTDYLNSKKLSGTAMNTKKLAEINQNLGNSFTPEDIQSKRKKIADNWGGNAQEDYEASLRDNEESVLPSTSPVFVQLKEILQMLEEQSSSYEHQNVKIALEKLIERVEKEL